MNFIQGIIHGYKVRKFFSDKEKKFKAKKVPTSEEINLISILEKIPFENWYIELNSNFNKISTLRLAIETKTELGIIKIRDEGYLRRLDIEVYDSLSEKFLFLYENINSLILENLFREIMRKENPFFVEIEEREKKYEASKLKVLTKEMSENLFRADDKYSKRSYKYSKGKWVNGKFVENPSKYNSNEFKVHKYFSRAYFNKLKVGQTGYVIREYMGHTKYFIYKCEIVKKDFLSKIVVFKVEDGIPCNNNILNGRN